MSRPVHTSFVTSAVPPVGSPSLRSTCPALLPPPVRIGYEVVGRGPVHVLFVPGLCVSRRMWDAQIEEFRRQPDTYSLCLLDNRGSGESDIPAAGWLDSRNANYDIETLARDAWTVADDVFGKKSKIHVIGWSMGSMIAQRIALLRISRVASLALLSGHAGGWLWSNVPSIDLAVAALELVRCGFDLQRSVDISLQLHYTDSFLAEMVIDEETRTKILRREKYAERYRHGIKRDKARDKDGSVFWGHLAAVRSHNLTREESDALRDAPFETIVIYGKHDKVVLPCASKDLARRLGAAVHEVPGAHFIIDEAHREVNNHLACLWKTSLDLRDTVEPWRNRPLERLGARWRLSPV